MKPVTPEAVLQQHQSKRVAASKVVGRTYRLIDQFQKRVQASSETFLNKQFEAIVAMFAQHDLAVDRRKSFLRLKGPLDHLFPEGQFYFIDKRDHSPRNHDELVRIVLDDIGFQGWVWKDQGMYVVRMGSLQ